MFPNIDCLQMFEFSLLCARSLNLYTPKVRDMPEQKYFHTTY